MLNAPDVYAQASAMVRSAASEEDAAVAAAAVLNGNVIFSDAAGSVGDGQLCTAETTIFMTASISKTFTALACQQSAERNELDIDADISSYAGQTVRNPFFPDHVLTLRNLLQHKSGLRDDESALLAGPWRTEYVDCSVTLEAYVCTRLLPGGAAYKASL